MSVLDDFSLAPGTPHVHTVCSVPRFRLKWPFTRTLRVAARKIVTQCISVVEFTHTLCCALLRCTSKNTRSVSTNAAQQHAAQRMRERSITLTATLTGLLSVLSSQWSRTLPDVFLNRTISADYFSFFRRLLSTHLFACCTIYCGNLLMQ